MSLDTGRAGRSIAWRLVGGFAAMTALIAGCAAFGAWQLNSAGKSLDSLLDREAKASQLALKMQADAGSLGIALRDAVLQDNATEVKARVEQAKQLRDGMAALSRQLEDSIQGHASRQALDALRQVEPAFAETMTKAAAAIGSGDSDAARSALTEAASVKALAAYQKALADLAEAQRTAMDLARDEVHVRETRSAWTLGGLALAAAALAAGVGAWLTRSIVAPARVAIAAAQRIATGDLTGEIPAARGDELGRILQAMGGMQHQLREMVGQVRQSAGNIEHASGEVAAGSGELSARTEEAAASLQQTASSMAQLLGNVTHGSDAATQATRLADSARDVARRGGEVVSEVVATMDRIHESSRRIADIIGTIDGIAFQTNILALNAAVEAARAGEQGRGFSVVAAEVRTLAQRSAAAAREIKSLIGASVSSVESGSRLVSDAGATMDEIVESVRRVGEVIGRVSGATSQQTNGIGEVNHAVTQLDRMTQQNAALVEQSAAAAQHLKEQAAQLTGLMAVFRTQAC